MATVPIFGQDVRPAPEVPCEHGVTDKDLDNIVSNVSAKYHRVLIHLGLSSNAIETLEIKHHKDPARVLFEGLVQWQNEKPRSSHCLWEDLLKAIEEGAENGMYAEEWRTELRERGIRTCEQRPEMEVFRDVTGSHLGSTASASAAELKTRSGTSLRKRHLLPQQQQQKQKQQQQPVQKRSDTPSTSQGPSSQTSVNSTRTRDLNELSSSNHSASRSSDHSCQITTAPIGLHQKAPSPAIAQDDMMELHQEIILYTQVACRLFRHSESEIEHLSTVPDSLRSEFKTFTISVFTAVLSCFGILLLFAGCIIIHHLYSIYNPIEDLDTLIPEVLTIFGMSLMILLHVASLGTAIKASAESEKILNEFSNWIVVFDMLCLQFGMAHKEFLLQLNDIMQEYSIDNRYDVLRQTFKSFRKDNTQFTLGHFFFAQRQIEDKSLVAFHVADATAKAVPQSKVHYKLKGLFACVVAFGSMIIVSLIVTWVTVKWYDIVLSLPIILIIMTSSYTMTIHLFLIFFFILKRKEITRLSMGLRNYNILVSYQIKLLQPLAQLFDSIIPGRLTWLRNTGHQLLFT